MRKFLFILLVWTGFTFCLTSVAIAQQDRPAPDRPRVEQQMQRIRQAQNELNEQRQQLEMEWQELELERERMKLQQQKPARKPKQKNDWAGPFCVLLMVLCLAIRILSAVWVFQDIRTRGTGSGIWVVFALIAGLLGVLVYAVVRLGDAKQS